MILLRSGKISMEKIKGDKKEKRPFNGREELSRLKEMEMKKLESESKDVDPDLLLLKQEDIAALSPEQLQVLENFLFQKDRFKDLIASVTGSEAGREFLSDARESFDKWYGEAIKLLEGMGIRRIENFIKEEKRKLGADLNPAQKEVLINRLKNEDYFFLYYKWLKRQFEEIRKPLDSASKNAKGGLTVK